MITDEEKKKLKNYERRVVMICLTAVILVLAAVIVGARGLGPYAPDREWEFSFAPGDAAEARQYYQGGPEQAAGVVTGVMPRVHRGADGLYVENFYARIEYYMPETGENCHFHHLIGPGAALAKDDKVTVAYDSRAADACSTSKIQGF